MPTVLIADNDPQVNSMLAEFLSLAKIQSEAVHDGQAALDRVERGDIAVLICDLDMPVRSGLDVMRELAAADSAAPAVFIVSGHLDAATRTELEGHEFVRGVWAKPFDLFAFTREVEACLQELQESS